MPFARVLVSAVAVTLVLGAAGSAAPQDPRGRLSVQEILRDYERGEFNAAVTAASVGTDLRVLIKDLNQAVPDWLPTGKADERRRLAIASLSLEVVMTRRNALWSDSGKLLLEWACSLLRRNETPLPAERLWHLAAIGVIQGASDAGSLERHLGHAEARFPNEPRFILARAIAIELRTWPEPRDGRYVNGARPPSEVVGMAARFEKAVAIPEIRAEAYLRWAFYDLRSNQIARALDHLDRVQGTNDAYLIYLRHLFRGRALTRADRLGEAIDAYQSAMATVPQAQTARLALGSLLARENRRQDAVAVVSNALTLPGGAFDDPWTIYGGADQRFWPTLATELRREVRR